MGKLPLKRVKNLINKLHDNGYFTKDDIIEEKDISESTFKRTLKDLRDILGIEISYSRSEKRYKLSEKSSFMENISDLKLRSLKNRELIFIYSFIKGIFESKIYFPPIDSHEERDGYTYFLNFLKSRIDKEYLDIANHIEYRSSEHYKPNNIMFTSIIDDIIKSFQNNYVLSFRYRSTHHNSKSERFVQPIKLINYQGKWYLIGYDFELEKTMMFNLSFIESNIRKTDKYRFKWDIEDPMTIDQLIRRLKDEK
ncbi:MAG: hypothetical protein CR982_05895 [Candidatus Cloacimonadota bacterium]|nr:MAG: hypothetical protein CR982_05895 [Candidatus Cloacimonadota bacterium]PIE78052.1 MAG: hypothetical protein CSA15_09455 [Candidatus Delongbacteria bacterium]